MKVLVARLGRAAEDNATSRGAREDSAAGGDLKFPQLREPQRTPSTASRRVFFRPLASVSLRVPTAPTQPAAGGVPVGRSASRVVTAPKPVSLPDPQNVLWPQGASCRCASKTCTPGVIASAVRRGEAGRTGERAQAAMVREPRRRPLMGDQDYVESSGDTKNVLT